MLVKNFGWNFSGNFTLSEKYKIRPRRIQAQFASRFHSYLYLKHEYTLLFGLHFFAYLVNDVI